MDEARSSWNTLYRSPEGFEWQITLRDEDEERLTQRAEVAMAGIEDAGGLPLQRRGYAPPSLPEKHEEAPNGAGNGKRAKSYVDAEGVRRCNQLLPNGHRCEAQVTLREGRYGQFWACPRYREHAPKAD